MPLAVVLITAGVASGWIAFAMQKNQPAEPVRNEIHEKGYELISPLLECGSSRAMGGAARKSLEDSLEKIIHSKVSAGAASHVSLYFRDLNNGPWIGINEDEKFAPGSMLKVPLMMAYYRIAESDRAMLEKKIKYQRLEMQGQQSVTQDVDANGQLTQGIEYSIEALLANMIIYSDNNSAVLLWDFIDAEFRNNTYNDLGLKVPVVTDWVSNFMTVRDYATFFRVLFFASYLNKEYSSHALDLLTKTSFKDGLVAGVPRGTKVAHKFGIRFKEGTAAVQLHDCGIIYVPGRPYLLCVMTKGQNLQQQGAAIAEISRTVYESVLRQGL